MQADDQADIQLDANQVSLLFHPTALTTQQLICSYHTKAAVLPGPMPNLCQANLKAAGTLTAGVGRLDCTPMMSLASAVA